MANVEPRVVQELLDQIENLERKITGVGNMTSAKSSGIDDVRRVLGGAAVSFDAAHWTQLSADKQKDLLKRLKAIRDELIDASIMDTRESNNFMQRESWSRLAILWLTIFGFIFVATLLSLIR